MAFDKVMVDEAGHLGYAFEAMYNESAPFLGWIEELVERVDKSN